MLTRAHVKKATPHPLFDYLKCHKNLCKSCVEGSNTFFLQIFFFVCVCYYSVWLSCAHIEPLRFNEPTSATVTRKEEEEEPVSHFLRRRGFQIHIFFSISPLTLIPHLPCFPKSISIHPSVRVLIITVYCRG